MSSFMENGSSDHNGEAEQVWERPWTLEEMQKNSTNWSLAADSGLFLFLQDFSQRMMSKTHEIEKQLDGLIRDTKATDSRLHTVFNDFLMLSNTQFIENRVYDEEVEEAASKSEASEKLPEQEKTREQKEAELIPKVQEAVNYGLMVLDLAFEQLDIKAGNSDSEDEEALEKVEPILEAKDLYVDRPLPFLIGSQAFMDQDDVGLGDFSSDEMSVDSDRDSVIESEDGESAEHSDDDDVNGSFKKKSSLASYEDIVDEDDDEDSDLFGGSDKEDDGLRNDAGQSSFADELAARIKAETPSKTEPDRTSLSSGLSVSQKKSKAKTEPKPQVEDDEDEMFKPPSMDYNEYSPFGGRGGLFSGGRGLFDDDNEGDLFSDAPKNEPLRKDKTTTKTAEPVKTKKMPSGAVSIFPESVENIERPGKPKLQAVSKQTSSSGGLFDDEDENDDDFFREKSNSKSTPVGNAKQTTKKAVDLFGGAKEDEEQDEDDGTMFSSKASAVQQDKSVEGEEETRPPEKKLPAGAISMFGPGTKSILVEGLKKRQHSASEESAISDESVPPSETVKAQPALAASGKTPSNSLFSDDEDSQIFLGDAKIKPKPLVQSKPNKASLSIFDDEEEEGLFSSMSKSGPVKKSSLPTSKSISSALFSDDEDQWKSKPESPEIKQTGIKPSFSAPSRLPTGKASQNNDLFNDDDDLFSTNDSSEKSSQRASLLFEDEDCDEDKDSFFNFTSSNKTSDVRATDAALFDPTKEANEPNVKKVDQKSVEKKPVGPVNSSEDSTEIKKKPIGGVSLFGGIDVFSNISNMKETSKKSEEEFFAYEEALTEAPPPIEVKSSKTKKTALSLFDDDDDDDDDDEYLEEIPAVPVAIPPVDKNTLKEYGPRVKSTGVFQDEELLFSQTQQRDNDPDVDLFTSSSKPMVPSPSSVKPAAATLFADDDEDDLFGPTKAPPKVAQKPSKPKADETDKPTTDTNKESTRPLKSKQTSSRIEKLQADLSVNPSTLLPGALPVTTSAVSGRRAVGEGGVSFESPALVSTLQNATKDRAKGAGRRRPQTRAARHLAAQQSEESVVEEQHEERSTHGHVAASLPNINPVSQQPTTLNVANTHAERSPDTVVRPKKFLDPGEDLFHSDDLFGSAPISKPVSSTAPKIKTTEEGHGKISSAEAVNAAKDQPSIFDSNEDTLFGSVKQMAPQKSKQMSFLDDEDDGDIFGGQKSKSTNSMSFKSEDNPVKHDIFQDIEAEPATFQKKNKDASLDASLFDNDDVDIFADLTGPTKPKEKKAKQKVETKSIFEEDMDDIFSTGNTRLTIKPKTTKKSTPDSGSTVDNIFDDPLNVFGGN